MIARRRTQTRPGSNCSRALDEEIERLPEPYRAAVVLCDLAGLTHDEAARQFGSPLGRWAAAWHVGASVFA